MLGLGGMAIIPIPAGAWRSGTDDAEEDRNGSPTQTDFKSSRFKVNIQLQVGRDRRPEQSAGAWFLLCASILLLGERVLCRAMYWISFEATV
jgi:hypothetical protein